jgi:hypothetical protein
MRRDVDRRLRRLEMAYAGAPRIEIWVEQGDGTLRCTSGECITRETFDQRYPPESEGVFVIDATDARL